MFIINRLRLAALCLLVSSLVVSPAPLIAGHNRHRTEAKLLIHEEFIGYGKTELAARKDALNNACNWLKQHPYSDLDWSPDPDYLLDHKMVQFNALEDKRFEEPMGLMKMVKMQLDITDSQDRDIRKQAQQLHVKERQKQALLVLLGAMGLLGVVGGYLRLEEATKGYYTRLLRIAAITLLVILVAGLYIAE